VTTTATHLAKVRAHLRFAHLEAIAPPAGSRVPARRWWPLVRVTFGDYVGSKGPYPNTALAHNVSNESDGYQMIIRRLPND